MSSSEGNTSKCYSTSSLVALSRCGGQRNANAKHLLGSRTARARHGLRRLTTESVSQGQTLSSAAESRRRTMLTIIKPKSLLRKLGKTANFCGNFDSLRWSSCVLVAERPYQLRPLGDAYIISFAIGVKAHVPASLPANFSVVLLMKIFSSLPLSLRTRPCRSGLRSPKSLSNLIKSRRHYGY